MILRPHHALVRHPSRIILGFVPIQEPACCESAVLHSHRLRLPRQQLPQHILQNPAVGVVERRLRCVDAESYAVNETAPCLSRAGRTVISMSCPSAVRKSMSRSTENDPARLRISKET